MSFVHYLPFLEFPPTGCILNTLLLTHFIHEPFQITLDDYIFPLSWIPLSFLHHEFWNSIKYSLTLLTRYFLPMSTTLGSPNRIAERKIFFVLPIGLSAHTRTAKNCLLIEWLKTDRTNFLPSILPEFHVYPQMLLSWSSSSTPGKKSWLTSSSPTNLSHCFFRESRSVNKSS